jgi:arsenate reductase
MGKAVQGWKMPETQLAREGKMTKVLFLCIGNSCRSQMAEGFLRQIGKGRYEVYSAGTVPRPLHPLAVRVMQEKNIDISRQVSKHVGVFLETPPDYVVTVCAAAEEACPVFPVKTQKIHWSFEDPAAFKGTEEATLRRFREIRDQIEMAVQAWLAQRP